MKNLIARLGRTLGRHATIAVLALAALASVTTYEVVKPMTAGAAIAPAAAPLDDNSVSALLSLDHAMETLAARVTPAIVNVAVTSRAKNDGSQSEVPDDVQRFFGPFFGPQMRPQFPQQPQIER
ncbi:MAG: protease Do, partial [Gaiellaceae bacterium]